MRQLKTQPSKRGGKRLGAGRPRKSERCACGKYTLRTAKVSRHKCREVPNRWEAK